MRLSEPLRATDDRDMPLTPQTLLDLSALASAIAAAWYWWLASRVNLRRLSKFENLDYQDMNRLIVSFNRAQILSGRAAFATGLSAIFVAARLVLDLFAK